MKRADRIVATETSADRGRLPREELHGLVWAAMTQLASNDRELLVLRYVEELTTQEIAQIDAWPRRFRVPGVGTTGECTASLRCRPCGALSLEQWPAGSGGGRCGLRFPPEPGGPQFPSRRNRQVISASVATGCPLADLPAVGRGQDRAGSGREHAHVARAPSRAMVGDGRRFPRRSVGVPAGR